MPTTDTSAPTDTNEAEYLASVERCRAASASASDALWIIADEACTVTKVYGEKRLNQFALDINWPGSPSTLGRMRPVARAFPKTGARPRFLSSGQVLQTHRDRIAIVTANPNISKAEAREIMRKFRAEQAGTATPAAEAEQTEEDDELIENEDGENTEPTATTQEDDTEPTPGATTSTPAKVKGAKKTANKEQEPNSLRDIRGWFNNQVERVNAVIDELNKVMENCTPEQHDLLATLEPTLLLEAFRKGTAKSFKFVDWVDTPLEKAADKLIGEGRVRITPARRRASQSVQPEA
jgi:hypothetical protein